MARSEIKADAMLKVLMDLAFHQDRILWNQIRTILTLQAGVLAAIYAVRGSAITYIPVGIGLLFTVVLYFFVTNCRKTRELNSDAIERLVRQYSSPTLQRVLRERNDHRLLRTGYWFGKRWYVKRDGYLIIRAHSLLLFSLVALMIISIIAAEFFRHTHI